MEDITTGLAKRAESILRALGTSELPRQLGESSFFVTKLSDETVKEEETFSFMGRVYKIGEMKKAPLVS